MNCINIQTTVRKAFVFQDGSDGYGEIQIRGSQVDEFAEAEHIFYNFRLAKFKECNEYQELYDMCIGIGSRIDPHLINRYFKIIYRTSRLKELGINAEMPDISDYVWYGDGSPLEPEIAEKLSYESILELTKNKNKD